MTNVLSQKAVLARLYIARWEGRITDHKVTGEVLKKHNAKGKAGTFTKRLISTEALGNITTAAWDAVRYHRMHTQPWLDDGMRILPTALFLDYQEKMDEFKRSFDKEVSGFLSDYKKFVGEAEGMLGTMFSNAEYPPLDIMRSKFSMAFSFLPCPDAGDFRCDIDDKHLDTIRDELTESLNDQMRTALADSADKALEVVSRMAERLAGYKPSAKKGERAENTFRDSLVENVREIAMLLPAFNINNDAKFTKLINRISKELCVHEAETLRSDETIRKKVAKSAHEITKAVEEFLA